MSIKDTLSPPLLDSHFGVKRRFTLERHSQHTNPLNKITPDIQSNNILTTKLKTIPLPAFSKGVKNPKNL